MKLLQITRRKAGNNWHPHTLEFEVIAHAKVDDSYYDQLSEFRWSLNNKGYPCRYEWGKTCFLHTEVLRLAGITVNDEVDHEDGDPLNALEGSLRPATRTQNFANKGVQKNSTSGFKGVSWRKDKQKWQAFWRRQFLGYYDAPKEAAEAYDRAALTHFGSYARTNKSLGLL